MKEVIERCNWLVNKCEDKSITPDVKDDISYLLEEIERLHTIIKEVREYIIQYGNLYCLKHKQFKDYHQYKVILEILDKEAKQ